MSDSTSKAGEDAGEDAGEVYGQEHMHTLVLDEATTVEELCVALDTLPAEVVNRRLNNHSAIDCLPFPKTWLAAEARSLSEQKFFLLLEHDRCRLLPKAGLELLCDFRLRDRLVWYLASGKGIDMPQAELAAFNTFRQEDAIYRSPDSKYIIDLKSALQFLGAYVTQGPLKARDLARETLGYPNP